jgi:hypothetical protein
MENNLNTPEEVRNIAYNFRWSSEATEERVRILQKCIQKAQQWKDEDLEFQVRLAYVHQVNWLHKKEKAIAVFPWLLQYIDRKGSDWDKELTLWYYKWVIMSLPEFAHISLNRIEALFDDMERRYKDFGAGVRVIHYFKMSYYAKAGQMDKAAEHMRAYLNDNTTSDLDDCKACQYSNTISLLLGQQNYPAAIEKFQPLLKKEVSCKEVPNLTYPRMALAYHLNGEPEMAQQMDVEAGKHVELDKPQLEPIGHLLLYYAQVNALQKARKVLEKQWHFCFRKQPEYNLLWFYAGFEQVLRKAQSNGIVQIDFQSEEPIPVALPFLKDNTLHIATAIPWIEEQVNDLIAKLDQRNGNRYYTEWRKRWAD